MGGKSQKELVNCIIYVYIYKNILYNILYNEETYIKSGGYIITRRLYNMAVVLSVSCSKYLRNALYIKRISPSKCFQVGARLLLNEKFEPEDGINIRETEIGKRERVQRAMQTTIDQLNKELHDLKGKPNVF